MKKPSKTSLRKKADAIFSRYIRQRDGGQCYTCSLKRPWKEMQCGHFVPRQYLSLRYDEVNCHCQCYACNMLYNGQPSVYSLNLQRDFGTDTVRSLEARRREVIRYFDYQGIIDRYKEKSIGLGYELKWLSKLFNMIKCFMCWLLGHNFIVRCPMIGDCIDPIAHRKRIDYCLRCGLDRK